MATIVRSGGLGNQVFQYAAAKALALRNDSEHQGLGGRQSVDWGLEALDTYDAMLIATDHDGIYYPALATAARLLVDTRNACARAEPTQGLSHLEISS
jgi:UDP-N-acetyl-D-mannosaminuronate dehydrogenase